MSSATRSSSSRSRGRVDVAEDLATETCDEAEIVETIADAGEDWTDEDEASRTRPRTPLEDADVDEVIEAEVDRRRRRRRPQSRTHRRATTLRPGSHDGPSRLRRCRSTAAVFDEMIGRRRRSRRGDTGRHCDRPRTRREA